MTRAGRVWHSLLATILLSAPPALAEPRDRPLPPWPEPVPAETPLRITAFGTSLTAGEAWPGDLEAALRQCLNSPVTVEVIARPGAGSSWALSVLDQVRASEPHLVLMEFAINDADILDGVTVARSNAQHREILTALQADAPQRQVLLMTMNPVTGPVRWAQRPRLGRYYGLYTDLADLPGVGLIDFASRWAADRAHLRASLPDGLHPMADVVSDLMVPPLTATIAQAWEGKTCGNIHSQKAAPADTRIEQKEGAILE